MNVTLCPDSPCEWYTTDPDGTAVARTHLIEGHGYTAATADQLVEVNG
jgi:hypothetical protein